MAFQKDKRRQKTESIWPRPLRSDRIRINYDNEGDFERGLLLLKPAVSECTPLLSTPKAKVEEAEATFKENKDTDDSNECSGELLSSNSMNVFFTSYVHIDA